MSLLALLLLCLAQKSAPARPSGEKRDEFVRIEVTCTALSGSSAYLDVGREAGLAPGDRMRLFPPTGAPRRGRITSVSRTSARCELEGDLEGLEIGLLGEVWVPRKRLEAPAPDVAEAPEEPEAAAPESPVEMSRSSTLAVSANPPVRRAQARSRRHVTASAGAISPRADAGTTRRGLFASSARASVNCPARS